jgi:ParB family chromosome partitioning protein
LPVVCGGVARRSQKDIPATIRNLNDRELLAVALVENLQRSDLNPIEEAQGYANLIADFGQTQHTVAELVGKDRSTVANMLRLLQLPSPVRLMLQNTSLSLGHARALLGLASEPEMLALAKEIVSDGLSVREVEKRVRVRKPTSSGVSENRSSPPAKTPEASAHIKDVENQLRKRLQTEVRISLAGADKGSVSIAFYSSDDLDRLLDLLLGSNRYIA